MVGLYLPGPGELLVARSGEAGALEAITLAHELEHALADDALGLPIPRGGKPSDSDADLAAQALVEGDATLTMELYALRYVDLGEQLSLSGVAGAGDDLEELPDFFQRQLLYPYAAGFAYVCGLYAEGGWEAVDDAYRNPPASTAELLDPGLRPRELTEPPPGGRLAKPWRSTLRSDVGAAELSWLFAAPGRGRDGGPARSGRRRLRLARGRGRALGRRRRPLRALGLARRRRRRVALRRRDRLVCGGVPRRSPRARGGADDLRRA